jgi:HPr kinase/phosphorylase
LTAIVEVAARNQLLKSMGHHSAMEFQNRVQEGLNLATSWSYSEPPQDTFADELDEDEVE